MKNVVFASALGLIVSFGLIAVLEYNKTPQLTQRNLAPVYIPPNRPRIIAPRPLPTKPVTPTPEFKNYAPLRSVSNLGKVLSDIESHMPAGHIYKDSDKITWGHETSHGIHSRLRMKFGEGKKINGFYVLNNRAAIIEEPRTTIQAAARLVPKSLRGGVYQLYMIRQASSWGDTPLYIFDEWVAYTNGAAVRLDLNIQNRQETVEYMLEFNVYAISVAKAANTTDPQFKNFLMWHLDRTMKLYESNKSLGDLSDSTAYWEKVKTSSGAESFRQYTRQYLGAEWTKEILGF